MEHLLLVTATVMTLITADTEVWSVYERRAVDGRHLLMFLYTEVIGMIAVFYTGEGSFFVFIAITALACLIVLQGMDMVPENVVFEADTIKSKQQTAISQFRPAHRPVPAPYPRG